MLLALTLVTGDPDPALTLRWSAPAECPTHDELRARLADAEVEAARAVEVDARIEPSGAQWKLVLDRRTADGHEHDEMTAERCEVLADVVVLLTTIALDPAATPRATGGRAPLRLGLAAHAAADVGTLPSPRPGAAATLRLFARWWSVGLRGTYLAATDVRDRDAAVLGAELLLWSVGARGCATPAAGPVSFPLCVGPEVGGLRGRSEAGAATEAWIALDLGAGVVWSVAPRRLADALAVVLDVDAVIGVRRPGFHLEDRGLLARAGSIAVRPTLGLEVRLPGFSRLRRTPRAGTASPAAPTRTK